MPTDLILLRSLIEPAYAQLSVTRQCELLDISKSGYYYTPVPENEQNLMLMRLLDEQYMKTPFYGVPRMHQWLCSQGFPVNIKRVRRLLRLMGLIAIYPKPNLSKAANEHKKYPYLLRDVKMVSPNQVWSSDITYIPMHHGFMYLTVVMDWYSRYVIAWRLSNSLDASFCVECLEAALSKATPLIFNTDQGVQYTSSVYTQCLENKGVLISMDGKGRAFDNIFNERLWRSVKYEYVYLNVIETVPELWKGLNNYFAFYNQERFHQSLDYKTPAQIYYAGH